MGVKIHVITHAMVDVPVVVVTAKEIVWVVVIALAKVNVKIPVVEVVLIHA